MDPNEFAQSYSTIDPRRGRARGHNPLDYYPTPIPVIEDILTFLDISPSDTVIDPCAGDGRITQSASSRGASTIATDISPRHPSVLELDFWQAWQDRKQTSLSSPPIHAPPIHAPPIHAPLWVSDSTWVLNPPYYDGFRWLVAVRQLPVRSAILLPLSMLAGVKRHRYWSQAKPPSLRVLARRPRFQGKGTAQYDLAWFLTDNRSSPKPLPQISFALNPRSP